MIQRGRGWEEEMLRGKMRKCEPIISAAVGVRVFGWRVGAKEVWETRWNSSGPIKGLFLEKKIESL